MKNFVRTFSAGLGVFALLASPAFGYVLEGQSWTRDRTVVMQLSLGDPRPLMDGFGSFNESAQDALNVWNGYLAHVRLTAVLNSPVAPSNSDDEMSAFFSNTLFGDKIGADTLAVTLLNYRGNVMEETDTAFNNVFTWDSYRGALRRGVEDFHRIAIHEFGHSLGLDHPDQATPKQTVTAIMNANESNVDTVQSDDIAGVQAIYSTGPAYQSVNNAPVMLNIATRAAIGTGDNVLIGGFIVQGSQPATVVLRAIGGSLRAVGLTDVLDDPMITIYDANHNVVATNDDWISSSNASAIASYHLDPPNSIESAVYATLNPGAYTAIVQSFSSSMQAAGTGIGLVEIYDLHTSNSRLGNISARGQVQTGDDIIIGGFIIGGAQTKTVVVRGMGPTLGDGGVGNFLADPTLELRDGSGNLVAANDNWQQSPNAAAIQATGLAPVHPSEAALQATVNPGNYTALVRGVDGTTGVGLVEVYDRSAAPQ
ncbi:MAG: matrixin family metalloprotease [Verrucomicrobiota bacterium]|nr:matrixin family metalloprotease [Verrucomicrobiota bacterium]